MAMKRTPFIRKLPSSLDARQGRAKPLRVYSSLKRGTKRMKQGRSTGKPTVAQARRWVHIRAIGCIACRLQGHRPLVTEVHHLTVGGRHGQKRRGHDYTIGLCRWHHRGELPVPSLGIDGTAKCLGPSYHHQARAFREHYGQDDVLLELQNKLIAERESEVAAHAEAIR